MTGSFKIGSLNPIYSSKFVDNITTHYDNYKINVIQKLISTAYNKETDASSIGSVKGIVVGINNDPANEKEIKPWPFDAGVLTNVDNKYVSIYVRIPEIHGFLPDPIDYLDTPEFNNIVKMYPVFTGLEKTDKKPIQGDIVIVDFFNPREKSLGGSYLETVSRIGDQSQYSVQNRPSFGFATGIAGTDLIPGYLADRDGIHLPGTDKDYEVIKGYNVKGDPLLLSAIEPWLPEEVEGISKENIKRIIFIISSGATTKLDFLSTQDKITMGFRRRASSGLAELMKKNYGLSIDDLTNNNFQKAIEISDDPKWWEIQVKEYINGLRNNIKSHKFTAGRDITLYERVYNSSPGLAKSCKSYWQLRERYVNSATKESRQETRKKRIAEVEAFISAGEIWR